MNYSRIIEIDPAEFDYMMKCKPVDLPESIYRKLQAIVAPVEPAERLRDAYQSSQK